MCRTFALAFSLLLGFSSLTFAQAVTAGTGAINGRVTDTSDAVMPGVTVTLTSPSQMGTRTAVTDADGTYRFTAVTPGDYVVLFELAGFSTVRNEGIRVSLGFTATVNASLNVASLQESVTVTGQSPVVDTSATSIGNTFDAKQLAAAPDLPRLLLVAGGLACGADGAHRRGRQHQRHSAGIRGVRHVRPGPRDL